ncbi:glutamate-1-semialdehyde 2,1-aminomutase [Propionicicella superfundia]|uniref:glutamate-1-semialdehyde 2,1-aminomutase n=1 Tax=Propionicicella superfundia TaxID=348582 RepID=UPI000416725F|nr:glutamate-1-semialdehyde 2,1-aminomutase [Propionicicella superfundia]
MSQPSTSSPRSFATSNAAQARLHELIPGGAHTYARGSDQCPEFITPIIERGEGARVLDVDGNWYVEYGMGLRAVTLGYGYRPVVEAATAAAAGGLGYSRPSIWELRAAECFLGHVPGADMVKFAKNGSDATTGAIKLARAYTGRDMVAVCGTQPFFSVDDWFIGGTPMNAGIPQDEIDRTVRFTYNDLASVDDLLARYPGRIAALILEQATATAEPAPGFLEGLRERADADGFLLVFDEMITGLRWSVGGAQAVYGVVPDLSTWGKAIGNGFSVSALAGKREFMELGGLNTDRSRVWLLSTTHGGETTGLAALLAVYDTYDHHDVVGEMEAQGERLRAGLTDLTRAHGLSDHVPVLGRSTCMVFGTKDAEGKPSQPFRTLFLQELLKRGVLSPSLVISWAHTDDDISRTLEAADGALGVYAQALATGSVDGFLEGRPVAPSVREFAAPRRLRA